MKLYFNFYCFSICRSCCGTDRFCFCLQKTPITSPRTRSSIITHLSFFFFLFFIFYFYIFFLFVAQSKGVFSSVICSFSQMRNKYVDYHMLYRFEFKFSSRSRLLNSTAPMSSYTSLLVCISMIP